MFWQGPANIANGVTIDLSSLTAVTVSGDSEITSAGGGTPRADASLMLGTYVLKSELNSMLTRRQAGTRGLLHNSDFSRTILPISRLVSQISCFVA